MLHSKFSMAILSVLAAVLCSTAANAQRSLPGIEIQIDNWAYIPTLYNGAVESFIALRTDAPEGNNITAMWFTRGADNTWSSWAWNEQNQSKTTGYVKTVLQISDEDDGNWRVAPSAINPDDFPPKTMIRGVFANDPFAETISSEANPEAMLDFLVSIGWSAAKSTIIGSSQCEQRVRLDTLSDVTLAELHEPGSGMAVLSISLAVSQGISSQCALVVISQTPTIPICNSTSPWTLKSTSMFPTTGSCCPSNTWSGTFRWEQTQSVVYRCPDCTVHTQTQIRFRFCTASITEIDIGSPFCVPGSNPCPASAPAYSPPSGPYGGPPSGGCPSAMNCGSWGDWGPPLVCH